MGDRRSVLAAVAAALLVAAVCITVAVLVDLDLPRREHVGPAATGGAVALVAWAITSLPGLVHRRRPRS